MAVFATSIFALLVIALEYQQTSAQLDVSSPLPCDNKPSRSGRPAELDPFAYLPYEEAIAPKVGDCFNFYCVEGKVEVIYQYHSVICDKPRTDDEWFRYVHQVEDRQESPEMWKWPVPERILDVVRNSPNTADEVLRLLPPPKPTSTSTAKPPSTTTAKPVSTTTTTQKPTTAPTSTTRLSTLIRSTTASVERESPTEIAGPKMYVPRIYNWSQPNPKWTKDLSALEIDYDELDEDEEEGDKAIADEEDAQETTTTTQRPVIKLTSSAVPISKISTTTTRHGREHQPRSGSTNALKRLSSTTSQPISLDDDDDDDEPSLHMLKVAMRLPNRIPFDHNHLDHELRVDASTQEEVHLKDPIFWNRITLVIIYTAGVLAVLYSVITIVKVSAWAFREYLKNKWIKNVPAHKPTPIRTIYNYDV